MRPPPWPTAWAPSVDATGADKYNPVDPADASPTSMIRVISPCGRLRRTPIPRTPVGRRRLAWAALAGIECSAMSHRYLGDGFDIHGGGLDLRFPTTKTKWLRPVRPATLRCALDAFAWVTRQGREDVEACSLGTLRPVRSMRWAPASVLAEHSAWVVRYALGSVQYRSMLEWSDQRWSRRRPHTTASRTSSSVPVWRWGQPSRGSHCRLPPTICPPISWPP